MRLTRRTLIAGAAVAGLLDGCAHPAMAGELGGADLARGHRLRDGGFPEPSSEQHTDIAIIGGGIAGLSAAWTLADAGVAFRLLELEDTTGGNARGGRNSVSAYPLGAHYLPIPNPEATRVIALLERLGIITGWQDGKPVFDPYQVVSAPEERLLRLGRWHEGLVPGTALSPEDRHDIAAFFAAMKAFRDRRDDGRPAFAIPMALSSTAADLKALDRISMTQWLDQQGWRSRVLHDHVRYACRDDYGTEPDQVSAWAGIHYFASRRGAAANVDGDLVLTWPEGNAHLARAMAARVRGSIETGRIVWRVERQGDGVVVDSHDVASGNSTRLHARAAILATPRFVTARLVKDVDATGFRYAPWIVANVTVDRPPEGPGFDLAWDNVSATSESLGYVVATHQSLATAPGATVLTWYMPLSRMTPASARRLMLERPLAAWQDIVRDDLLATNPDLAGAIRRIDVWRWGHAMIRPEPGFIWGEARRHAARPQPPLFFAHSDLSGFSIFEEAHHHGAEAAEQALASIRGGRA
ncbi:FAD-dependent oxidoreductase [uncultured Sphingomonas sp.]|uniref:FAD-dependent oxidoreductase n=1 Tax=uncultured Sphingomonas sp. TaxID=158754 RepID=UPI0025EBE350|nr:FAD-dependent oxidoreductase [uncultured Sphingomonas sp.]